MTGFIGRRLLPALLAARWRVRALVRGPAAFPAGVERRRVDLGDLDGLTEALAGADAVLHLAGAVRGRGPADFYPANVAAVANLCTALARQSRPGALLLLSSLAASRPHLSHYAASKRAGEEALSPGLAWTVLRPTAVYGPGDQELAPLFRSIRRGWMPVPGNPAQRLTFLHVDDLAAAIVHWLADSEPCLGGVFHIDDGAPGGYDWSAIAAAVGCTEARRLVLPKLLLRAAAQGNLALSRLLGRRPMLTPGKVRELTQDEWLGGEPDFATATGWRPAYGLAAGIRQTFAEALA